jgi:hypothetical protein
MIEILEALNTKEAVILCMAALMVIFALFVVGAFGLFMHYHTNKILKRVNALISHIGGGDKPKFKSGKIP